MHIWYSAEMWKNPEEEKKNLGTDVLLAVTFSWQFFVEISVFQCAVIVEALPYFCRVAIG